MNIKDRALEFAKKAHEGQVRKGEKNKPMINHPIAVAKILEDFGADDNFIAAAYLHDVVEDTKYTMSDIITEFGNDIANIVSSDTEHDKSLTWEERKQDTINRVKNETYENKMLICADKINNIEDMRKIYDKNGKYDFSAFKRGYDKQKWYYEEIYKSIIYNIDENDLTRRLRKGIDNFFYIESV